jgi:hypothetical protein
VIEGRVTIIRSAMTEGGSAPPAPSITVSTLNAAADDRSTSANGPRYA